MTIQIMRRASALERRIQLFYDLLNRKQFDPCYLMIDPRVLGVSTSVTRFQYEESLRRFLDHFGRIEVQSIEAELHVGEPNKLFEDRDFAVGQTTWLDKQGAEQIFQERWVKHGRLWYTRSTGFVTPGVKQAAPPDGKP